MDEYRRHRRRPRRPSTRALTLKFSALSVVLALAIGVFLAVQMAEGEDPALGPKATSQAKKASTASTPAISTPAYSGGDSTGSTYSPAPVTSSTS
jgi:hypothetical protein